MACWTPIGHFYIPIIDDIYEFSPKQCFKECVWRKYLVYTTLYMYAYSECPEPVDIPNALKMNNGLINGSSTLYACVPGYLSNGGNVQTMCNGTDWSPTNLSCSCKLWDLFD